MNIYLPSDYNRKSLQNRIYPTQMGTQSIGYLQVRCRTTNLIPIGNATVKITFPGEPNNILEQAITNESGLTELIPLQAPPIDYSLEPNTQQPYTEYTIHVSAEGFEAVTFSNIQILPDVLSDQNATLNPAILTTSQEELFVISPHTLYYEYPPKIPEDEIKATAETSEIVLTNVVIPEFVIVHDGPPQSAATNHWIRFRDYVKNVASSEIYATWPENSIYANVLAILSFTLNRVYTEWYRGQGFSFTITSSTAYDQKWINGRNIYSNISAIVDSVFINYLSRPNIRQPIFTQYCDGNRTICPGWMSQWGSKSLGDQGNSAIEILRYYYGDTIFINTAPIVSGVPKSWPGNNLTIGSSGNAVRTIQEQLNRISRAYPAISPLAVDGKFGPLTAESVRVFQSIFSLPVTGVVDLATWYKISFIYVAVARLVQ